VAVEDPRWNAHLSQLRRLVLHQSNQRRNHDRCFLRNYGRKLVAEATCHPLLASHASIVRGQKTADDILLFGAKLVVSPVAPENFREIGMPDTL